MSAAQTGTSEPARRATMGDIARHLGISKAAVSYALNGQPGVAAATRERVLEVAQEMGWHASSSARALSGSQTQVVGLVLSRPPDLLTTETFFMRFLAGVESVLSERGWSLLLRVIGDHPADEMATYERWWGERRIDGVILLDERYRDPRVDLVERIGLPAVLCGGPVKGVGIPCLWTDQSGDAGLVVQHLADLGHRRIGHVAGPGEFVHERARRRGLRRAAAALGVEVVTVEAAYTGPESEEATRRLLTGDAPPTAVVFGSDVMALGGVRTAAALGVRVPQEVSFVSWDDSQLTSLVAPRLTALQRDTPAFGRLAATVLLDAVAGRRPVRIQVPPSVLVARESSGPAPA
ncbi:LacI family DNA-binding transcriptional regulator [Luteipulveratus sp. YIM 133132]|uniref:LacI family DNA-binding transcriptional regulator n=1 Tax=Luteipulveratus flavus TaxID=3031728 RepID=A0ABT6C7R7_9MICO|nr:MULTISPECIES: LacI family DNA-binding transcriptional regulator [unclassified Luteipulveratus]MDE9364191.1 LacI family DNA-binding transcriptional regulator [Luteipulveratus sp. YIM 133132]MDF8264952.1 LacI family DNA-binding transcriptional regulator [Luteipulveratus sp. YIM 133296]